MLPNDDLTLWIQLRAKADQANKEVDGLVANLRRISGEAANASAAMGKMKSPVTNEQVSTVNKFNAGLNQTAPAANKAGKGLWTLNNTMRTAIGTFEAMAIFLVTKFIGDAIAKTIDSLKQLELSFYRLGIAERALSKAGVDITPQELVDIAKQVTDTYDTVSNIDALKMVSNLAVLTKDLKLTADQYEKIATAIPLIAQQSDTSIESATDQIITGLTKSGRGWADLGITVDAAIIKQQAIKDKLVESEEAYNNLTAEQKQQVEVMALINILYGNAQENLASQSEYLTTVAGKQALLNKEWETFTTELGVLNQPATKTGLDFLIWGLQRLIELVGLAGKGYIGFMALLVGGFTALRGLLEGNIRGLDEFLQLFVQGIREAGAAMEQYMQISSPEDTPTSPTSGNGTLDSQEDLQKALEKMNNEILEAQIKLAQDMEEAAIDLGRKLEDIAIEYAKKRADAERDYANTVRDINTSYSQKVNEIRADEAEANAKARNDELEREAEFQNKMLELKENYLMDLDEALHERDARQILRLMKQYNLDKTQAEREHALDQQKAQRDTAEKKKEFARRRQEAEAERKAKLAEAQQDLKDKLAKLQSDEEAERRAANLAYERKMQDLQREMHNRLALVAAALVQEFNLTKQGLDAIYKLYMSYYGAIAQVYAAMNTMLSGRTGASKNSGTWTANGITYNDTGNRAPVVGGHQRFAEGGTMIADRPTTVTFGEGQGLEMATFTPLNKTGRDVNKLFTNLGQGGSSMEGTLEVDVTLSPDLEARIVKRSMDETAGIITRVKNSKRR